MLTWDALREKQLEFGLDDYRVMVDSSHFTELVYGQCCRFDWTAIKGEKAPNGFIEKIGENSFREPVTPANDRSRPAQLPPDARMNSCLLLRVSEEMTAQSLHLFRTGRAKGWTAPKHPPADWSEQMAATVRRARQHKTTGQTIWEWVTVGRCGEHQWDCERHQVGGAHLIGVLDGIEPITITEKNEPDDKTTD